MQIDWLFVAKIASPILSLLFGAVLNHYLERRPKLITYYGHVSAFRLRIAEQADVFTHSIVIRNSGRKSATNVSVGHSLLPRDYQIYPAVAYEVRKVPDTGDEIFFPRLVPGEQVTISYLYMPPLTYNQVNTYVKSDEGFAKVLYALPTPQPPKWLLVVCWALIIVGAVSLIYVLLSAGFHYYAPHAKA
jgi:hypothetical protein